MTDPEQPTERWVIDLGDDWYFSPARRLPDGAPLPTSALDRRTFPSRLAAIERLENAYTTERYDLTRELMRARAMLRRAKRRAEHA